VVSIGSSNFCPLRKKTTKRNIGPFRPLCTKDFWTSRYEENHSIPFFLSTPVKADLTSRETRFVRNLMSDRKKKTRKRF
jgi:hypothetical protein